MRMYHEMFKCKSCQDEGNGGIVRYVSQVGCLLKGQLKLVHGLKLASNWCNIYEN